jgi:hypothetical protein
VEVKILQVFGFSYEGYVLDTQILFPHVFLPSASALSQSNECYKNCADEFLKGKMHWIILPSNEDEFNLLILEDFRKLLQEIRIAALRCKNRGHEAFSRECVSQIRSKGFPNDFLVYWNLHKGYFLRWLTTDEDAIRKEERSLLRDVLERYWDLTDHAELKLKKWENPEHEKDSQAFYDELQRLKNEGLIPPEAHNEDFHIISDCLVYCTHLLQYGILYLITDDNACYGTVKSIVKFKEGDCTFHVTGFDCKGPREFLRSLLGQKT